MGDGILAGLSGALSGYEGALGFQYEQQKKDQASQLQHERQMSLENLRASNKAANQDKRDIAQEGYRKDALTEGREYSKGVLGESRAYAEGKGERDFNKWLTNNPNATEVQKKQMQNQFVSGTKTAVKPMTEKEFADHKRASKDLWRDESDTFKRSIKANIARREKVDPSTVSDEDAFNEYSADLMVRGGGTPDYQLTANDMATKLAVTEQLLNSKDPGQALNALEEKAATDPKIKAILDEIKDEIGIGRIGKDKQKKVYAPQTQEEFQAEEDITSRQFDPMKGLGSLNFKY